MIESSLLSPNRQLYGNLHNMGHNLIAYIHDPDGRFLVCIAKNIFNEINGHFTEFVLLVTGSSGCNG